DKREWLDFRDLLAREHLCVEIGQLPGGTCSALVIDLRDIGRGCQRIREGAVVRDRPASDGAAIADDDFRFAAGDGHPAQAYVAAFFNQEIHGFSVWSPTGVYLAVIDLAA